VLAHELGHAVVAQAKGIVVRAITLFMFGGVALLDQESEDAGDEFQIAIAGPAVSVAVAALSGLIWLALRGASEPIGAIFGYLASANLTLVVFNLIPAYPLDGGRVLRAAIWGSTGSMRRATRIAASVGMVIGYVFIVVGIYLVFRAPITGVWLVAIGWFLRSAADQSMRQLTLESAFGTARASTLMDRDPVVVPPDITLQELVDRYILGQNARGVPVLTGRDLLGIVTLTDVKDVPREEWGRLVVRERMTPRTRLVTASPTTSLDEMLHTMSGRDIHQVPVVTADGALVGLVTRNAIIQFLELRRALVRDDDRGTNQPRSRPAQAAR
jgi:Zn-dependent protease